MTGRERIFKTIRGEKCDRAPWTPLIDGYYLSTAEGSKDQIDAIREFNADIFARHIPASKLCLSDNGKLREAKPYTKDDGTVVNETGNIRIETLNKEGVVTQRVETPVGVLTSTNVYNEVSPFIPFPVKHRIETVEDIEVYKYFASHIGFAEDFDQFERADRRIGSDGVATVSTPSSPFHVLMEVEAGIERFYYLLNDYPEKIEDLFEVMQESHKRTCRMLAKAPAEIFIDYENTSTTTLSPALYRKYIIGQINDYADIFHSEGKLFMSHMCGTLRGLEKELSETKLDGILDIAPYPTGNMSLREAHRAFGSDRVVMGGIDATAFNSMTPGGIYSHVTEILNEINGLPRVFLGSGDATPQKSTLANMRAVTKAVNDFWGLNT